MGPLQGVKIVELAGIGPGPFAGMLLSDMGADIVRIDRAGQVNPAAFDKPNLEPLYRGPALDRRRPEEPRGRRARAAPRRAGRRADRGLPARRDRAARPRSRRVPRPQPEARLRAHDGLGSGRPDGAGRRATTSTTSRSRARSRTSAARAASRPRRSTSSATSAAAACSWRSASCAASSRRSVRARARCSTSRWSTAPPMLMTMMWGLKQIGFWDEALGANVLDTGAPFYDTYETADGKFVSLGSLEPQFYAELIQKLGLEGEGLPAQMDKRRLGRAADALHRSLQDQDARRVGRDPRRQRRLLRAGAHDVGGDEQRAHRRPQDDHRARRRAAARARAALLAHDRRDPALGAVAGPAHRRGARPTGVSTAARSRSCGRPARSPDGRVDASVSGRRAYGPAGVSSRRAAVPPPSRGLSVITPSCSFAICSTIASPRPEPGTVRASSPGRSGRTRGEGRRRRCRRRGRAPRRRRRRRRPRRGVSAGLNFNALSSRFVIARRAASRARRRSPARRSSKVISRPVRRWCRATTRSTSSPSSICSTGSSVRVSVASSTSSSRGR